MNENEIDEQAKRIGRKCGDCSLCCYILKIDELKLPMRTCCDYQSDKLPGCMIYKNRPRSCRDFSCNWLIDPSLDENWFPLKSGLFSFYSNDNALLSIHSKDKDGWKKTPYYKQIKEWAIVGLSNVKMCLTMVFEAETRYLILPDRDVEVKSFFTLSFDQMNNRWNVEWGDPIPEEYFNQYT